jgi:hypothetical protein
MVNLSRRRFFFSAAIIPAANLMPGHSLAAVLAPTPRELILQNLAMIKQELDAAGTIKSTSQYFRAVRNSDLLHHALGEICKIGVERIGTPSNEDVARYWRRDPAYVPTNVLPVTALETALTTYRSPAYVGHPALSEHFKKFVEKYKDGIVHAECKL